MGPTAGIATATCLAKHFPRLLHEPGPCSLGNARQPSYHNTPKRHPRPVAAVEQADAGVGTAQRCSLHNGQRGTGSESGFRGNDRMRARNKPTHAVAACEDKHYLWCLSRCREIHQAAATHLCLPKQRRLLRPVPLRRQ